MRVAILLATYQGESWLEELLLSLVAQTHKDWALYARDDGSHDDTLRLLEAFRDRGLRPTLILPAAATPLGPTQSFSLLLGAALEAGEETFFFCDQDDVWEPLKIERSLDSLRAAPAGPALVHTDLSVADKDLQTLSPSFRRATHTLDIAPNPLPRLLAQNFVTGCTVGFNRALAEVAYPVPPDALMHDWWVALLASATGTVRYVDEPLIRYRQHGSNASGGVGNSLSKKFSDFVRGKFSPMNLMRARLRQMRSLERRLRENQFLGAAADVEPLLGVLATHPLRAVVIHWRGGVRLQGWPRTLLYYLCLGYLCVEYLCRGNKRD